MKTDWVEVARRQPLFDIGQLTSDDVRELDQAVRRGDLVSGRAPFFGRMATKACYAASHEALAEYVAAERRQFDACVAADRIVRANR